MHHWNHSPHSSLRRLSGLLKELLGNEARWLNLKCSAWAWRNLSSLLVFTVREISLWFLVLCLGAISSNFPDVYLSRNFRLWPPRPFCLLSTPSPFLHSIEDCGRGESIEDQTAVIPSFLLILFPFPKPEDGILAELCQLILKGGLTHICLYLGQPSFWFLFLTKQKHLMSNAFWSFSTNNSRVLFLPSSFACLNCMQH